MSKNGSRLCMGKIRASTVHRAAKAMPQTRKDQEGFKLLADTAPE